MCSNGSKGVPGHMPLKLKKCQFFVIVFKTLFSSRLISFNLSQAQCLLGQTMVLPQIFLDSLLTVCNVLQRYALLYLHIHVAYAHS